MYFIRENIFHRCLSMENWVEKKFFFAPFLLRYLSNIPKDLQRHRIEREEKVGGKKGIIEKYAFRLAECAVTTIIVDSRMLSNTNHAKQVYIVLRYCMYIKFLSGMYEPLKKK